MKNIFLSIIILVSTSFAADNIEQYLPKQGVIKSHIMLIGFNEDMQKILKKYGESIKKNEKWFKEYKKQYKGIFPLPYHKNLGLTNKEYEKFKGIAKAMTLVEKDEITISVANDTNATTTFLVKDNPKHFLNGLKIYKDGTVKTRFGKMATSSNINRKRASTGNWTGVEWVENKSESGYASIVKFALGKRDRGDNIIYYDVETFSPKSKRDYGYILYNQELKPDIQKKLIHIK